MTEKNEAAIENVGYAAIEGAVASDCSTSWLVRLIARAEILIAADPVKARDPSRRWFREKLFELQRELDGRVPRDPRRVP